MLYKRFFRQVSKTKWKTILITPEHIVSIKPVFRIEYKK